MKKLYLFIALLLLTPALYADDTLSGKTPQTLKVFGDNGTKYLTLKHDATNGIIDSTEDILIKKGTATKATVKTGSVTYSTQYVSAETADSFSASQTIDWAAGNVHSISLTGSITSSTWSNPVAGGRYAIALTQGGTGSYTVAWPASVKWSGGVAPTLTTTVGKTDIISCVYIGTTYYCGAALNF